MWPLPWVPNRCVAAGTRMGARLAMMMCANGLRVGESDAWSVQRPTSKQAVPIGASAEAALCDGCFPSRCRFSEAWSSFIAT
jgi:hypothetical protein